MRKPIKKPELLSPAGAMESLYAAVNNGCDAVYLGGKQFSARQSASNFSLEELEAACDFCHLRGVKLYVTVNTLYKQEELASFYHFIADLYRIGVDALIMQDIGAAKWVMQTFPDFPLHASTQLTANTKEDVCALAKEGFQKVVLSRELSLPEIQEIKQAADVEIETFIHGALCVSYSGQCIMSSMLGGRSGNRGRCAQTCRLPYSLCRGQERIKDGHLLSPKDIATIEILPELIEAGIDSFKIEGRMKNPEYVAGVTAIYRKYINRYFAAPEKYTVEETDKKILLQLFNRGGFTNGYYHTHSGSQMMSTERPKPWGLMVGFIDSFHEKSGRATIRTREPLVPGDGIEVWTQTEPHTGSNISRASRPGEVISLPLKGNIHKNDPVYKTHDKALMDQIRKTYEKHTRKKEIAAKLTLKAGEKATLALWDTAGNYVFVQGDTVEMAANQPLALDQLQKQVKKTGATPFCIAALEVDMQDGIYVGIKSLNELRRTATDKLAEMIVKKSKRTPAENFLDIHSKAPLHRKKQMNVLVSTKEQFDAAVTTAKVNTIYIEMNDELEQHYEGMITTCKKEQKNLYVALPRISRSYTENVFKPFYDKIRQAPPDGFLVRSIGQLDAVLEQKQSAAVDFNMNVFNQRDVSFYWEKGACRITLSPEMNLQEIVLAADGGCEMLVYGYLPVMTTHQCPIGAYAGGKESGIYCSQKGTKEPYDLKDRKGMHFPLLPDCRQCVCSVLNSKPLFTLKFFDEILESPTGSVRLNFTIETGKEIKDILNAYAQMLADDKNPGIDAQILIEEMAKKGSTKGHYFRGVE